MKRIGILTVSRADYGILRPVVRRMIRSKKLSPFFVVTGSHLQTNHGLTVKAIEHDGFEIGAKVEMLSDSDSPEGISHAMGLGMIGFSQAYSNLKPDLLLVAGDRFETISGALAAVSFNIPIAHLHGGELSLGAIDDAFRHALTKLSHVHFASTEAYAGRIAQMGEEEWRIHVSGAPSLDALSGFEPLSRSEFESRFGIALPDRFLLATYHPITLATESDGLEFESLLEALLRIDLPVLFTLPNADPGNHKIRDAIRKAMDQRSDWFAVESLGTEGYFSAMSYADAMVGNSSSGIIEALSFKLPVVNVGPRQEGRERGANVIDVGGGAAQITAAIEAALSDPFRKALTGIDNPYGDGTASNRIVQVLEELPWGSELLRKHFVDRCR